jgi:DNA polymerase (family 10)
MQNHEIARLFVELADRLEINAANPFRVRAYRTAAQTIADSPVSMRELVSTPGRSPEELPGIGADLAGKIKSCVESGTFPQLEELRAEIPEGVLDMLRIPGLGPKRAGILFRELGVTTLAALEAAAVAGRVAELKGFGKKIQGSILEGLPHAANAGKRFLLAEVKPALDEILAALSQVPGVEQVCAAGSARRLKDTIGDLDVLVIAADNTAAMDALAAHPAVSAVLSRGETKQRVRLSIGVEMDLRVVPAESYGAALQYFTGSKEHNITVRKRAVDRGLKINEYGVFRGEERVAGTTEAEVYAAVELPWIPPELRENRDEFTFAEAAAIPKLIEPGDIRGDMHMHTTATDGAATIAEMIAAAKSAGLEYIAITDHSKRVSVARGLDADRLRAHWAEIRKVREKTSGIEVLCGIECDIREDASMDLPDDVLAEAEWVVAVLHYGLKQPRGTIMRRLLTALRHPHVDAIGHPSGRMLGQRPGVDWDRDAFLSAARDTGKMLEINADPHRLDLDDVTAAAARSLGIPLVISTDAHATTGLLNMPWGVYQARRAGLEAKHVANTRPWSEFKTLLPRYRR